MKTLILGIGNTILSDDGVGIKVTQKIKEEKPELDAVETSEAGIALLDYITGYDKLILIDSMKTGKGKPGDLYKLGMEDLESIMDLSSSHRIDFVSVMKLGNKLGYRMPEQISIYAIEIEDNTTFGESCTRNVEERIPFIARQIVEDEEL